MEWEKCIIAFLKQCLFSSTKHYGKPDSGCSRLLMRAMTFLNISCITEYAKEFAVSPGCTKMI
jgi:hypothetical protein